MAYTEIDRPDLYFNTKLYTGNGSTQSINGIGFQPDWVWIKSRNTTEWHHVIDAVRGGTNVLFTNTTNAEDPRSGTGKGHITSFDTDGFTTVDTAGNGTNISGSTYASWNWLASNTTVSNTDGSITSTVSANTTSGFSIGTYTGNGSAGATIGHGLGSDKVTIIIKRRDTTSNWAVKHYKIPATQWLQLDQTDGANTASVIWNNTEPTSSVFSVGSYVGTNASGGTYVFYAFAEKKGFSKFGSYIGNGNANGPYIHLGMKPSFVIIKASGFSGTDWQMYDNKRNTYNSTNNYLRPNLSNAEATGDDIDFLSNGFKIRTSSGWINNNTYENIYMAFAENPFVTSTGIPTTAR